MKIKRTQQLEQLLENKKDSISEMGHGIVVIQSNSFLRIGKLISQILEDNEDLFVVATTSSSSKFEVETLVVFASKDDLFDEFYDKAHPKSRIWPPMT